MKMPWDKPRTGEVPDIPEFLRRGPDNLNTYMRSTREQHGAVTGRLNPASEKMKLPWE